MMPALASIAVSFALIAADWTGTGSQLPLVSEPQWQSSPRHRSQQDRDLMRTGQESWPYAPFKTIGRDIVDNRGEVITWAGVNWPLNDETMLPEGLEYASAEKILALVASVGFNFVRMGYAFEMVDQIFDRGGEDVPLEISMIMGLGLENGTKVTRQILENNPSWTAKSTRFEIWSDIVDIAYTEGLIIHPDLHVGKAKWCCSHTDGNAWFEDLDFETAKWHRALAYVANWAKSFPNIVSMSLRNELRESWNNTELHYSWQTMVVKTCLLFGQDLSALTSVNKNIFASPCYKCTAVLDQARRDPVYFDLDSYPWGNEKLVWELHLYNTSEDIDTGTCDMVRANLYRNGFNALGMDPPAAGCDLLSDCPPPQRLTPVILSEFGQTPEDSTIYQNELLNCIKNFTTENRVSWSMWSLAGYFRVRQGVQGFVDPKGMLNTTFNGWHNPSGIENWWKPWIRAINVTGKE